MPALNFMKQFVARVEDGSKGHSIRRKRKRAWKVGDRLALYTGMRTRACRLLFRTVVTKVQDILIAVVPDAEWAVIKIDDVLLMPDEMEAFAQADGFADHAAMMAFWQKTHTLPFHGDIIHWKYPGEVKA